MKWWLVPITWLLVLVAVAWPSAIVVSGWLIKLAAPEWVAWVIGVIAAIYLAGCAASFAAYTLTAAFVGWK